jgi:hypothetical protein
MLSGESKAAMVTGTGPLFNCPVNVVNGTPSPNKVLRLANLLLMLIGQKRESPASIYVTFVFDFVIPLDLDSSIFEVLIQPQL